MSAMTLKEKYVRLAVRDCEEGADLIIGFGHFDMRIPRQCALLYQIGLAPKILLTGGIGAGSGNFSLPESVEFFNYIQKEFPNIDTLDILIEKKSTNTGENVKHSMAVLAEHGLKDTIKRVILVATPTRQLRAFLTMKLYFPEAKLINLPPVSTFDLDKEMNENMNMNFEEHLNGEIKRINEYPSKGYCARLEDTIYTLPY